MVEHISIYFFIAFKTHKHTYTLRKTMQMQLQQQLRHIYPLYLSVAHKGCTNKAHCNKICRATYLVTQFVPGPRAAQNGWQSCWWYIPSVISIFRPAHMEAFADPTIFSLFIKFFRLSIVKSGRDERFSLFIPATYRANGYYNFLPAENVYNRQKETWQTPRTPYIFNQHQPTSVWPFVCLSVRP